MEVRAPTSKLEKSKSVFYSLIVSNINNEGGEGSQSVTINSVNNFDGKAQEITIDEVTVANDGKIQLTLNGNAGSTLNAEEDTDNTNALAPQDKLTGTVTINKAMTAGAESNVEIKGFNEVKLNDVTTEGALTLGGEENLGINKLEAGTLTVQNAAELKVTNVTGEIAGLELVGQKEEVQKAVGSGGKATVTDSNLEIGNINVANGGALSLESTAAGQGTKVVAQNINVTDEGSSVTLVGAKATPATETAKEVNRDVVLEAADVSITDGGKLELRNNANATVDNITVSKGQLYIGAGYGVANTVQLTVENDINLEDGSRMLIGQNAATAKRDDDGVIVSTHVDVAVKGTLTVGKGETDEEGNSKASSQLIFNTNDKQGNLVNAPIVDLTSIEHLNVDGGAVLGLYTLYGDSSTTPVEFQTKLKDVTFKNVEGSELKIHDLNLVGEGQFEVAVEKGKGEESAQGTLQIDKLTVGNGGNAHLIASDVQFDPNDNNKITSGKVSTFQTTGATAKNAITVEKGGHLTLDGNSDFGFELKGKTVKFDITDEAIKAGGNQSVLRVDSRIDVQSGGTISGNGYIKNTL